MDPYNGMLSLVKAGRFTDTPLGNPYCGVGGLFGCPVVGAANYSTENLQYLDSHDWLGKELNRVIVHL